MQRSLPRPEALLASARCGMAVLSREGTWLAVNPALCRLLGEAEETLVGHPTHRRLFPGIVGWIDAGLQAGIVGETHALEFDRDAGGRAKRYRIDVRSLEAGASDEASFLLQLEEIADAERMRRELEQVRNQQEHLAFGISHDLRASLRGIEGFALQLDKQPLDAKGREQLERIRSAAAQAGQLADALVQLARASTAAYADAPVDVSMLALWVVAELQDAEPQRDAEVSIQPDIVVRGDERHLRLMLQQLLHNAWKFSAGSDRVRIAVEGHRRDGRMEIGIRDNGSGFDMRYADRIFLPFKRLHGPDQAGGVGLGLAIADAVARRHGGRIRAESVPAAGSRFFVELPVADAGSEA